MTQLTEETYKDFIKEGKTVVKMWSKDCPFCEKYKPVFDEAELMFQDIKFGEIHVPYTKSGQKQSDSKFREEFMKIEGTEKNGVWKLKDSAPGAFIFENGYLKSRMYGFQSIETLKNFIETGEAPPEKTRAIAPVKTEFNVKTAGTMEIKALLYDKIVVFQSVKNDISFLEDELVLRNQVST